MLHRVVWSKWVYWSGKSNRELPDDIGAPDDQEDPLAQTLEVAQTHREYETLAQEDAPRFVWLRDCMLEYDWESRTAKHFWGPFLQLKAIDEIQRKWAARGARDFFRKYQSLFRSAVPGTRKQRPRLQIDPRDHIVVPSHKDDRPRSAVARRSNDNAIMPVSAPTGKPSTSAITISREQSGPLVPAGSSSQTSGQSATTILSFQAGTNKYFLKRRGSSQAKKSVVEVIPHSNKRQRLTPASIVPLSGLELSQHVTIPESNPPAMEDDTEAYEEHDNSKAVPTLPVPQGGSPNLQQLMVAGGAVESASSIAPSKDVIFPGMTRSSLQPGIFVASSTLLSRFGRCIDNPRDTRAILEDAKALPVSASTASSSIASSSFMVALSELRSTKGYVGAAVDDAQSRILYLAVVEDNINVERELSIMGLWLDVLGGDITKIKSSSDREWERIDLFRKVPNYSSVRGDLTVSWGLEIAAREGLSDPSIRQIKDIVAGVTVPKAGEIWAIYKPNLGS